MNIVPNNFMDPEFEFCNETRCSFQDNTLGLLVCNYEIKFQFFPYVIQVMNLNALKILFHCAEVMPQLLKFSKIIP